MKSKVQLKAIVNIKQNSGFVSNIAPH